MPYADPYLLPMAALLSAIGVTVIYRLDPDDAFRQSLWIVIGVALFALTLIALRRDYRVLESYKYLFGLGALVLLALPALPGIGQTINGARLWVKVGPLQFQPGELAKILLIVFLAGYLRDKREVLAQGRLKDFGPLLLIWGAAMLVLVQTNDLGSALLYFGIFLAMLYVATGRALYAAAGSRSSSAAPPRLPRTSPTSRSASRSGWIPGRRPRLLRADRRARAAQDCGSFQLVKSLYSIGNGGFGGTGLGRGTFTTTDRRPDHPVPQHGLHLLRDRAGARARRRRRRCCSSSCSSSRAGCGSRSPADDGFSKLLAAGLTFGFALQTFIIVGGVLRVIPLTGITLPFVSYGGSSVVANFILLALLLLVSNRANAQRGDREQADLPPRGAGLV